MARESATFQEDAKAVGFDGAGEGIDIAGQLDKWQAAGDERVWKFIVSPEFGDRTDLERLARDLMKHMEIDLGTELEWIAVAHHIRSIRMFTSRFEDYERTASRCG